MYYYQHHIGDFRSGTVNMTRLMRWIYRDMLDVYYDTESPLPADIERVCDLIGVDSDEEISIVKRILRFKFQLNEDGYRHIRCDEEIAEYRALAEKNQKNGALGGRPKGSKSKPKHNPMGFQSVSSGLPVVTQSPPSRNPNHEPITNNHKDTTTTTESLTDSTLQNEQNVVVDENSNKASMPPQTDPVVESTPAVNLTVALRKVGVNVTSMNPTLLDWIAKGVTIPMAMEAVTMARAQKPAPQSIPPGYLNTILTEMIAPRVRGPTQPLPELKKWYETASGIEAKAKNLGVVIKVGEPWPYFRDRVVAEAKSKGEFDG